MSLKSLLRDKMGLDGAVLFTIIGRGLSTCTAVFTVYFITRYLTGDEQGYYYTFGSIVAMQVFFELGLNGVITQFVAHEAAHLKWGEGYSELIGPDYHRSRLSSILRFCVKWYTVLAAVLLVALVVAGFVFFGEHGVEGVNWRKPWVLLSVGTAVALLLAPVNAFIQGLGKVKEMAKVTLFQQILFPAVVWGGLILGAKLYVSGMNALLAALLLALCVWLSPMARMLITIWRAKGDDVVPYGKEIFPLQWRIALSWVSGYFIFQLFNPVLFATEGATVAGQMGMSLSALNALQALTLSWIYTKVPTLSAYVANRDFEALDALFSATFRRVCLIGALAVAAFVSTVAVIDAFHITILGVFFGDRFLPLWALALMAWSSFSMFPVNCWATYLRCHKKEPLLLNSVVMGVACCCSTIFLGDAFGLAGVCGGFAVLRLLSLIWIYSVYLAKRREWHAPQPDEAN